MAHFAFIDANTPEDTPWPLPWMRSTWNEAKFHATLRDLTPLGAAWLRNRAVQMGFQADVWTPVKVPEMLSEASADLMFGEAASYRLNSTDEAQKRLQYINRLNEWDSFVHSQAKTVSSEGAVLLTAYVDPSTPVGRQVPKYAGYSPQEFIPRFSGNELTGAQVIREYYEDNGKVVYRLFETHEPGRMHYHLRSGTPERLGPAVPVDNYPRTVGFEDQAFDGDRLLVAYWPNRRNSNSPLGVSDYRGLEPLFFAMWCAIAQGQRSFTAAELRIVADKMLFRGQTIPAGMNVIQVGNDGKTVEGDGPLFKQVAGDFDANTITPWQDQLLDYTLMLNGMAPESVGRNNRAGTAESGTARRLAMSHTLVKMAGKGRHAVPAIDRTWHNGIMLDQEEVGDPTPRTAADGTVLAPAYKPAGGPDGFKWPADALTASIDIELKDGLPPDPMENADLIAKVGPDLLPDELMAEMLFPDRGKDSWQEIAKGMAAKREQRAKLDNAPFANVLSARLGASGE